MRLLTVGSLPPEWGGPERGGVATFHASLLSGLLERVDVEVVGTLPPSPLDREVPMPVFARPADIGRAAFYGDLLERLRPDAVVMNHVANTFGVTHARLRSPPPALGVVHSWHNVTFRAGEERRHAMGLTEEAMSGLSGVVVPSQHGVAEGHRLGFRYPAVVEAIHNPLQPLYMDKSIDVAGGERHGVVFLGGLIPRKDPGALVEAAALLPGTSVVLAGKGELEEPLLALIDRLGLDDRVRLAELPRGDDHLPRVRDLLLGAELLCLPSRSESFGLAFIEALSCGTPIVGFGPAVREIRDAVGIEVGEPLDTESPEEIAAAIERVGAAAWDRGLLRRAAISAFGLPRIIDRYVRLLQRVTRPTLEGSRLR